MTEAHRCEQLVQGCYAALPRVGFEPTTCWSQVQRPTHCAIAYMYMYDMRFIAYSSACHQPYVITVYFTDAFKHNWKHIFLHNNKHLWHFCDFHATILVLQLTYLLMCDVVRMRRRWRYWSKRRSTLTRRTGRSCWDITMNSSRRIWRGRWAKVNECANKWTTTTRRWERMKIRGTTTCPTLTPTSLVCGHRQHLYHHCDSFMRYMLCLLT